MDTACQVPDPEIDPVAAIEAALVELRRHQQAGRLQRRAARENGRQRMPPGSTAAEEPAEGGASGPAHPERPRRPGGHRGSAHARAALAGAARFRMLDAIAAEPGQSVTGLAERIGVDQPRASRLVMDAVDNGLVRRSPDPVDARRWVIELTASGRALLDSAHENRRRAVVEATAGFSDEERRAFAALLTRFAAAWPAE